MDNGHCGTLSVRTAIPPSVIEPLEEPFDRDIERPRPALRPVSTEFFRTRDLWLYPATKHREADT